MIKCPFCQFENEDGALFCEQCKTDLATIDPVAVPVAASVHGDTIPLAADASATVPMAAVVEHFDDTATIPEAQIAGDPIPMAAVMEQTEVLAPDSPILPIAEAMPLAAPGHEATIEAGTGLSSSPDVAPLPIEPLPTGEAAGKLPAGAKPKLVVLRGQRLSAEYPIYDGDNFVGRADEKPVDVDLEDQEPPDRIWSSRQHALITLEDGKLAIEDLNSLNGTFVNRTRVQPGQKRPLQVDDVIQIGTVQMKVKI